MATWVTPIPPNDVVAGDPGHPGMHNELSDNVTEIRTNVDLVEGIAETAPTWAEVTGKPTTFAPVINATATGAVAGNDTRLTAGAAGVATVRAIGATATTVVAGNDARLTAAAAGTASVRALGTTATTAAAGNDSRLLISAAGEVPDSTAADIAAMVEDFNELLVELRARGVIT